MKLTKKLLALVLAMVMAFSLMAVTAAAYGAEEHEHTHACTETIEPKGVAMMCDYCGRGMLQVKPQNDGMLAFKCMNETCKNRVVIVEYPDMG